MVARRRPAGHSPAGAGSDVFGGTAGIKNLVVSLPRTTAWAVTTAGAARGRRGGIGAAAERLRGRSGRFVT